MIKKSIIFLLTLSMNCLIIPPKCYAETQTENVEELKKELEKVKQELAQSKENIEKYKQYMQKPYKFDYDQLGMNIISTVVIIGIIISSFMNTKP